MTVTRQCDLLVSGLVLRKIEYGDSDLIVQVLTDSLGQLSLIARAARASKRRFAGGIEPFHGLRLHLDEPLHGDLYRLRDTQLVAPRFGLVGNLMALDVAGRALGWVRSTTMAHSPEPLIFDDCCQLLDRLDQNPPTTTIAAEVQLCQFGLVLLAALGWALELERCVRCGRVCPEQSPATVDPRRGGLVCRRCGGASFRVTADVRRHMLAASRGDATQLDSADAAAVLDIIEATLFAHPGVER